MSRNKAKKRGISGTVKWTVTIIVFIMAIAIAFLCWKNGSFDFRPGSVQANDEAVPETSAPVETEEVIEETIKHKVFISSGKGGKAEPSGCIYVVDWDSTTVYFTPDEGYRVKSVTVDGVPMGDITAYTLSYVKEDHVVMASFEKIPEESPEPSENVDIDDGGTEQMFDD